MAITRLNIALPSQQAFWLRLATGGIFGLIIAALIEGSDTKDISQWRETAVGTLALVAFVIWAGAGSMRRLSLAAWTAVAATMLGCILWIAFDKSTPDSDILFGQLLLILPLLFISHELVSSGDQAGKAIAPYETYFDEAWKRGVQLALAILFTLLFWGILWLGAALLGFIGFDWLKELLLNAYFAWAMSGLAFGSAVHLGDVQTKLLANVRNLILGVLAWLLPVITIIGGIFAGSLLLSGLAPLWATKAATATLLSGCVGFVLLINAAYQQGDVERHVPIFLKWCVRGAALLLLIFAVLAAWSLGLRINQYGLSPDRVFAGLGVVIALAYGVGYGVGVFVPGRWMRAVEPLNIGLAIFKCALFIAILTPIAAPNRLSVADQVARLNSGKVSVADFDWWLLKDETGKYGKQALDALAASPNPAIASKAKAALEGKIGERPIRDREETDEPAAKRADILRIPVVFPRNAKLPDSFVTTEFRDESSGMSAPGCLRVPPPAGQEPTCKIALLDLNADGEQEILVREGVNLSVFTQINGRWTGNEGYIQLDFAPEDFDAGKIRAAPPLWNDLMVGDNRTSIPRFSAAEVSGPEPESQQPSPPSK